MKVLIEHETLLLLAEFAERALLEGLAYKDHVVYAAVERAVEEAEASAFDREALLAAITEHDAARGWIVPLPDYDHVHRVARD